MATVITKRVTITVTEDMALLITDGLRDMAEFTRVTYDPSPLTEDIAKELERVALEFENALPVASFTDPNDFNDIEIVKG